MAERTVLLDATAEVRGAHLTLIANGTVAVVSAADFPRETMGSGTLGAHPSPGLDRRLPNGAANGRSTSTAMR